MSKTRLGQKLIAGLKEAMEHARGAKKLRTSIRRRTVRQRDSNR
jgi:hypothetical protein